MSKPHWFSTVNAIGQTVQSLRDCGECVRFVSVSVSGDKASWTAHDTHGKADTPRMARIAALTHLKRILTDSLDRVTHLLDVENMNEF